MIVGTMKVLRIVKSHWLFSLIILLLIVIKVLSIIDLGYDYSINSDDLSYINSGITLYEEGKITMHGVTSAQIMPGLPIIIAMFCFLFGIGATLILVLKIFYAILFIITVIVFYKIALLFSNKYIASIVSLFFIAPDYIWMNNLILTETPFILFMLLLIYYSLLFLRNHRNKDFYLMLLYFIIAIYIRPNIIVFPIALLICLLIQKYNIKELVRKLILGISIVIISLIPWIYRNYKTFDMFIPLIYGSGNPLLLGTYQGSGYPLDEELNYEILNDSMSKEMQYYLSENHPRDKYKVYYSLEYDKLKAEYRISEWWKADKVSFIKSYLIFKPKIMLYSSFYWEEVFNIDIKVNLAFRIIDLVLFLISSILILIYRTNLLEYAFLMIFYILQIILYCVAFAYERYAITLFPIRFIIIAIGLYIGYDKIKTLLKKTQRTNLTENQ